MLAFQASGTGSIPVRCNDFFSPYTLLYACGGRALLSLQSPSSLTMKQPLPKRRRISSNLHTPFSSSEAFATNLHPSRISACTSCHRIVGLKSSPSFLCARLIIHSYSSLTSHMRAWGHHSCNASTCPICLRTCTGDPWWAGSLNLALDATTIPLAQRNANTLSPCRIRSRDEDSDDILKTKDADNTRSGCGQMVCRKCCFEHPQRSESIVPYHALWAHTGPGQWGHRLLGLLDKAACTANRRLKCFDAWSPKPRPQFDL